MKLELVHQQVQLLDPDRAEFVDLERFMLETSIRHWRMLEPLRGPEFLR